VCVLCVRVYLRVYVRTCHVPAHKTVVKDVEPLHERERESVCVLVFAFGLDTFNSMECDTYNTIEVTA
jgi:hypothetical protein